MPDLPLILVKVLLIVGLGGACVWWQLRDLAREKELAAARKKSSKPADLPERK